jgi:hypothetical protein
MSHLVVRPSPSGYDRNYLLQIPRGSGTEARSAMDRRTIPTLLAGFGAFFLVVGAAVEFVVGLVYGAVTAHVGPVLVGVEVALISGALGVLALVLTYYARGGPTDRLVGGTCLLVLGAVGALLVAPSPLSLVGALFVLFAGLLFALEGVLPGLRSVARALGSSN